MFLFAGRSSPERELNGRAVSRKRHGSCVGAPAQRTGRLWHHHIYRFRGQDCTDAAISKGPYERNWPPTRGWRGTGTVTGSGVGKGIGMITVSGIGQKLCLFTGAAARRTICAVSTASLAVLRRLVSRHDRWWQWRQQWHDAGNLRWTGRLLYVVPIPPYPGGGRIIGWYGLLLWLVSN